MIKAYEQKQMYDKEEDELHILANRGISKNNALQLIQARLYAKNNKLKLAKKLLIEFY